MKYIPENEIFNRNVARDAELSLQVKYIYCEMYLRDGEGEKDFREGCIPPSGVGNRNIESKRLEGREGTWIFG